jgi:DNA invertase Pin-like site-specific DNA recombinase
MGSFLLTPMAAAAAELEAGLIGERAKNALAAARARAVKLGESQRRSCPSRQAGWQR